MKLAPLAPPPVVAPDRDAQAATAAEAAQIEQTADALEALGIKLPCQRPVRMIRDAIDTTTGEVTSSEEVLLRCNSRLARVCPSCAALYRGDIQAIMRDGLQLAAAQGETIIFLTLTAPGFGPIHYTPPVPPPRLNARRRAAWERRHLRRCQCGQLHAPEDRRWKGLPATPDSYDYCAQVAWNSAAGRLWSRTAALRVQRSQTEGQPVKGPKSGKPRRVPLAEDVLPIVHSFAAGKAPGELLFTGPEGGQLWASAFKRASSWPALARGRRLHDLRHTAACLWLSKGVDPGTVQAWLGHSSIATTNLYLHHLGSSADAAGLARLNASADPGGAPGVLVTPPTLLLEKGDAK